MRIVHLPFYDDNPYQTLLMKAQRELGHEVWDGGGGGNFLGVALREWKADLLHFHWLHPYLLREDAAASMLRASRFLIEIALLKARGSRIAWTIHNLANHDGRHAGIERFFTCAFVKLCDSCFAHSQAAAHAAAERFGIPREKLRVIPHGHYIGAYPNEIGREEARARLSLPAAAKVYLFFGRVEPYKGVFDLIDAFSSLPDDCHLVIAGKVADAGVLPELERKAAGNERIHLHPRRIPDEKLQIFFNAADVVVFPFRRILTSGSLVLAMSFGKAIVAPRIVSLQEIVPDRGVRWFDPKESNSLSEAMAAWESSDLPSAAHENLECARKWDWKNIAWTILAADSD